MTNPTTFRDLMDLWDEAADEMSKNQIKDILDGGDFILFFRKGKDLFAATENSRVVFATMKNPDKDEIPSGWVDEANFTAINLNKALEGLSVKQIFSKKDLKDIKVMESDDVYKLLVKKLDGASVNLAKAVRDTPDDNDDGPPEEAPNMKKLGEK